ncbi:hypothetical protein BDV19DRAFT_385140 [Aspergillus venezuelensis]
MADLEDAIQIAREAVNATPERHPGRAGRLNNLGMSLLDRHLKTGAMADLEEAISHQESALHHETAFITTRIRAGRNALRNLALLTHWQQAYQCAVTTVHLIPRLTLRSLENSDKQHLLSEVVGFASDAAATALNAQKGALSALTLLELGRGVLAASLEEVRVDIQDLQHTYPVMAEKFVQLQTILDTPITHNLSTYHT